MWTRRPATVDSEIFIDGLIVTGTGMGIVFAVLAILMAGIVLMRLADRYAFRSELSEALPEPETSPVVGGAEATPEIAAAIAVAMALAEEKPGHASPSPRPGPASGVSPWILAGRRRLMERGSRPRR